MTRSLWEHTPTPDRLVSLINILCDCVTSTNYNTALAREAYLEIALVTSLLTVNSIEWEFNLRKRSGILETLSHELKQYVDPTLDDAFLTRFFFSLQASEPGATRGMVRHPRCIPLSRD